MFKVEENRKIGASGTCFDEAIYRTGTLTNLFLRCIAMNESAINWDEIPDVINGRRCIEDYQLRKDFRQ